MPSPVKEKGSRRPTAVPTRRSGIGLKTIVEWTSQCTTHPMVDQKIWIPLLPPPFSWDIFIELRKLFKHIIKQLSLLIKLSLKLKKLEGDWVTFYLEMLYS